MNRIERPAAQRWYEYDNNSDVNLSQFHFVFWNNGNEIALPVLGYIADNNGLAAGAAGKICSEVGAVWQISQIADDCVNLPRWTVLYMTPGVGNFHATPIDGDYKVGFLTVAQAAGEEFVTIQFTPPERVSDDELST
jgi:hypothetical protein